jgi:hypothetical protein
LDGKRYPDNGYCENQPHGHVRRRKDPPAQDNPKDIAKDAHDGSAGIVHYPSAERGQLKRGNLEALDPKRNPHNCDAKEHPSHAPQNRSDNAASEYPD